MRDVHIAGVSLTRFGKDFRPIGVMLADACQKALQYSAAFTSELAPDCLVIGAMDPLPGHWCHGPYWICQANRP
jgi:hypothetical protein